MEKNNLEEDAEKLPTKEELNKENNQLKYFLILMGIILIGGVFFYFYIDSLRNYNYHGIDFTTINEGKKTSPLIFYRAVIPLHDSSGNLYANYNIYLRTNPRKLEKVPFNGTFVFKKQAVINLTDEFKCEGDEIIAVANIKQMYDALNARLIKNESIKCDPNGQYTYISLKYGNNTEVQQTGPSCYEIYISNCEILKGTEKLLIELAVKVNEQSQKNLEKADNQTEINNSS